jgi:hypothetical protein
VSIFFKGKEIRSEDMKCLSFFLLFLVVLFPAISYSEIPEITRVGQGEQGGLLLCLMTGVCPPVSGMDSNSLVIVILLSLLVQTWMVKQAFSPGCPGLDFSGDTAWYLLSEIGTAI